MTLNYCQGHIIFIIKLKFSEVQALYELCTSGTDIKGFCVQQGVNYQKLQTWGKTQRNNR